MFDNAGLSEFRDKFKVDELIVARTTSWTWSVRPLQTTIGAGVLSANRYVERFSDLSAEEGADLLDMVQTIESTLGAAFSYDKLNYLMLMMVDTHVHFHVIPRYSRDVEFGGHQWTDSGWPKPPNLGDNDQLSTPELLAAVREVLREQLER
jgi:diadenosine tetraphosphate (Ap4A) HIT family hydrolase